MFCQQIPDFSIPFAFENMAITKICYEGREFDHLHLLLAYNIFLREILETESTVLLQFDGN